MPSAIIQQPFASINRLAKALGLASLALLGSQSIGWLPTCSAGEPHQWFAGTYLDPAIQRPDFFPHAISRSIPEYRQVYNRPRNLTGWIAYKIEPSSQEAMAWQTNHCNGNYQNHAGAYIPMYCYPCVLVQMVYYCLLPHQQAHRQYLILEEVFVLQSDVG